MSLHTLPSALRAPPRELIAAAQELFLALAELADPESLGLRTPPYAQGREQIARLLRALTGLSQVERGSFLLTWRGSDLTLNDLTLPQDRLDQAAQALRHHMGARAIDGLVFRYLPEEDQLLCFFRLLRVLDAQSISQLARPGQLVTLPGERDLIGFQLLIGDPRATSQPNNNGSGLGARTAFEAILKESSLDWIGAVSPPALSHGEPPNAQLDQRFCLSTYTNLVSTTLRILRSARDLYDHQQPIPALAMHRLAQQTAQALSLTPDLVQACLLLGARDPSPARHLAHAVILALGMAQFHGYDPSLQAELGLATFLYGLARGRSASSPDEQALELLGLLASEQALSAPKLRALHAATLALRPRFSRTSSRTTLPASSSLIVLAFDFAAALDGSLCERPQDAPLPALSALQAVQQNLAGNVELPYAKEHIGALARWLGPLPAGSVVQLLDGDYAVVMATSPELLALPLLAADLTPLPPPAAPVSLGRRPSARQLPSPLPIQGLISARPLVDRAVRALFSGAQHLWGPLVGPL